MTSDLDMVVYNNLECMEDLYNKIPEGKRMAFCEKVAEHLENDILDDVIKEAIEEVAGDEGILDEDD